MLARVEETVIGLGARLIVVETSAAEPLARARRFYEKYGYQECGRVPHFYAENETKVIFARSLRSAA
jgi:ribosomal protein S18 acetylase RimI-like enzyme